MLVELSRLKSRVLLGFYAKKCAAKKKKEKKEKKKKKTAFFKNRGLTFGAKIPDKMALYLKFYLSNKSVQSEALFNLI